MKIRTRGLLIVAVLGVLIPGSARGYILDERTRHWAAASAGFEDGGASLHIEIEGDEYSNGIPPRPFTGKGSVFVCVTVWTSVSTSGCFDVESVDLNGLQSASASGTVTMDIYEGSGEYIATEDVVFEGSWNGVGPTFPGAGVSTGPDPSLRAGVEVTRMRNAMVDATISSPTIGILTFPADSGLIGHTKGYHVLPFENWE